MSTDTTAPDPEDLVAAHWPLYGDAYTPAHLAAALGTIAELLRFANYATGTGAPATLPNAPAGYEVLGNLERATGRLGQFGDQLADWARGLAEDPTLQHDENPGDHAHAAEAARAAAESLSTIRGLVTQLNAAVNAAHGQLGQLGHRRTNA